MYEALRAYFVEGRPSAEVAHDFNYSAGSFQVLCHHFRRDPEPIFFVSTRPGPRSQPKKTAARELVVPQTSSAASEVRGVGTQRRWRWEEHTAELQSREKLVH